MSTISNMDTQNQNQNQIHRAEHRTVFPDDSGSQRGAAIVGASVPTEGRHGARNRMETDGHSGSDVGVLLILLGLGSVCVGGSLVGVACGWKNETERVGACAASLDCWSSFAIGGGWNLCRF
jgi:hypothetical protein